LNAFSILLSAAIENATKSKKIRVQVPLNLKDHFLVALTEAT